IPGIEIGDYDPLAMEFADLVYATEAGVVIGWDHPGGFDDFMLALPCPNPTSFTTGSFDDVHNGLDLLCAHENESGVVELLVAANLGDRDFAAPVVVSTDLPDITPLR